MRTSSTSASLASTRSLPSSGDRRTLASGFNCGGKLKLSIRTPCKNGKVISGGAGGVVSGIRLITSHGSPSGAMEESLS
ncbi:MAG: hypothetical protein ACK56F_16570, partial [bacterium]